MMISAFHFVDHLFNKHGRLMDSTTRLLQCEQCTFSTIRRFRFREHLLTHQVAKTYACRLCHRSFRCKSGLQSHITCMHKPKDFVCSYCGYAVSKKDALERHMFRMHTHRDYKPYKCGYCEFVCASSQNCRKHVMARHKGMEVKWVKTAPSKPVYGTESMQCQAETRPTNLPSFLTDPLATK